MMKDLAIIVENLTKIYRLYDKPINRLKESLHPKRKIYHKDYYALDRINFEVKKGETVGIIGKNGAGKSTLLKIITGVLTPTRGQIQVNGRVLALLELGAGFNPELTGIENIYFNGIILGASQEEMDQKIESIINFADIGEYIYQPVKKYSSGMYVRLAFGIIANMDAEVLIVDEALAVGDAAFTQKCMRYIRKFQEKGTLLFVSHDTGAVLNLCQSAVWLEQGKIYKIGKAKDITEEYLQFTLQEIYGEDQELKKIRVKKKQPEEEYRQNRKNQYQVRLTGLENINNATGWKTGVAEIKKVNLESLDSSEKKVFEGGERVRLHIMALAYQELISPILGFVVKDRLGQDLFGENTLPFTAKKLAKVNAGGRFKAEFDFMLPMLPNGQYAIMASVAEGDLHHNTQHHYLHDAYILNVNSSKIRWGLVGIAFDNIKFEVIDGQ